MEEKEDINALDEIHKGACMGIDAISFVLDKVEDKNLKAELEKEEQDYNAIKRDIEEIYLKKAVKDVAPAKKKTLLP